MLGVDDVSSSHVPQHPHPPQLRAARAPATRCTPLPCSTSARSAGRTKPSQANQHAFDHAIAEVEAATRKLLEGLTTTAPPKDRDVEAAKARARAEVRYARG